MKKMFAVVLSLFIASAVWAVPNTMNYQGRLLDSNGIPVASGTFTYTVSIYDAASGGTLLYQETHSVTVDDGVYNFELGGGSVVSGTFNSDLFDTGSTLYVELAVDDGGGPEILSPRTPLRSSPFTLQSDNSQNLGNNPVSFFGTAADVQILEDEIRQACLQGGGTWSPSAKACTYPIQITPMLVLPSGGGYIPVSLPFPSPPDACAEYHLHGTQLNCAGQPVPDPAPGVCGHGTESEVIEIDSSLCG